MTLNTRSLILFFLTSIVSSLALANTSTSNNNDWLIARLAAQNKAQDNQIKKLQKEVNALKEDKYPDTKPHSQISEHKPFFPRITVTTSPLLGRRSAFDATDLIVFLPTMNEDLRFLQQRQIIEKKLGVSGDELLQRGLVELSGAVVGQAIYQNPYVGTSTSDIDLAAAEFDVLAYISSWITARDG